jgi:hypothetical protein
MAFSQTSGGEFERRAFVRCAGGKTRYFASARPLASSRVQLVPLPACHARQTWNGIASLFGTATFFKRI